MDDTENDQTRLIKEYINAQFERISPDDHWNYTIRVTGGRGVTNNMAISEDTAIAIHKLMIDATTPSLLAELDDKETM